MSRQSRSPGLALHERVPASRWCVTRKDLLDFERDVRIWHHAGRIPQSPRDDASAHNPSEEGPSMYEVTEHFIKPVTLDAGGMSYALMLHPEGLECDLFVTHAWAEGVYEFCAAVRRAWPRGTKNLWCCFLANPQNGDLGDLIGRDVGQSPFALALHSASHMIAIPNRVVSIYSRLWCVYEAKLAMDLQVKVTLPSASMYSVLKAMLVAVDSGLISFAVVILVIFLGGVAGPRISKITSYSTVSVLIVSSVVMRCITRVHTKKLAADMLVVGALLALFYARWVKICKELQPLNCFMDPEQLSLLQKSHVFANIFHAAGSCVTALLFERVLEKSRKTALLQEGHLLEFSSVRDARCFNNEDEIALWGEMKGKEDEIDRMIKVLRAAGAYDSHVRADLEMGIEPSHGRRVKPVRAIVVCFLWAVCFQANMADAQPASPVGYWTFYAPWTSFGISGISPAFVAFFIAHDRLYRRRIQYVVNTMGGGILIVLQCYCSSFAVSSVPSLARWFRHTIFRSVHSMCWSYCVAFSLSAFCAILGPQCTGLIRLAIHSRDYVTFFMFGIVPLIVPIMQQHFLCTFERCVADSGLDKDQLLLCTNHWTMCVLTTCLGVMLYAAFIAHRLKRSDVKDAFKQDSARMREAEMVEVSPGRSSRTSILEEVTATGACPAKSYIWHEYRRIPTKLLNLNVCNALSTKFYKIRENWREVSLWICVLLSISMISMLIPDAASRQEGVMVCPGPVASVSFSPDGTYMVTASHAQLWEGGGWISLWEMNSGWEIKRLSIADPVTSVACSPEGNRVLTGFFNGTVMMWDFHRETPLKEFKASEAGVTSIAFSPDGQKVLTGAKNGVALLWNIASGQKIRTFGGHHAALVSVAFSADGKRIFTASAIDVVTVWIASTGAKMLQLDISLTDLTSVAFSPDGKHVLIASQGFVTLYDSNVGGLVKRYGAQSDWRVSSVAFSPAGLHILVGFKDGTTQLIHRSTGRSLQAFEGPLAVVNSLAFSPDGHHVLIGSSDSIARLWQARTGELITSFQGHTAAVTAVAFSANGQQTLTGSSDKTAKLWDAGTGEELQTFQGHHRKVTAVAFGLDGRGVWTSSLDGTAVLWVVDTGQVFRKFQSHDASVTSVAFSWDGQQVLVGSKYGISQVFEVHTSKMLRTFGGHAVYDGAIESLAFRPDGKQVFVGSSDGEARVWSLTTGELLSIFKFDGTIDRVTGAFSPHGLRFFTVNVLDQARFWKKGSGAEVYELNHFHLGSQASVTGHSHRVNSVALSPDAKQLVTGSQDGTARLWEVSTGQILMIDMRHVDDVSSLAVSQDGRYVLTGSLDRTARLWEVSTGNVLMIFRGHTDGVLVVAYSRDGKRVATGAMDCTARVWEAGTGNELTKMHCGHFVNSVAFSPDGQQVVTGTPSPLDAVALWDVHTGSQLASLSYGSPSRPTHNRPKLRICVTRDPSKSKGAYVAFSPNGQQVATSSNDRDITLWETRTGKLLKHYDLDQDIVVSLAFHPDGQKILTGSTDGSAYLWEASTGRQVRTFRGHKAEVTSVAFSPDGQRVLTGSLDQTAKVWETSTGNELAEFKGRHAAVSSVAFSPDGQLVLLASDITARSWKLSSATLLHEYGLPCRYWLSA